MNYLLFPVVAITLVGCSTSTGVVPVGNNAYYVSIRGPQVSFGPPVAQKADAYKEANEYCSALGLRMEQVEIKEVNQVFGRHGSAQLTFKCIKSRE